MKENIKKVTIIILKVITFIVFFVAIVGIATGLTDRYKWIGIIAIIFVYYGYKYIANKKRTIIGLIIFTVSVAIIKVSLTILPIVLMNEDVSKSYQKMVQNSDFDGSIWILRKWKFMHTKLACENGNSVECFNHGVLSGNNKYYNKACDGGVLEGCFNLGLSYTDQLSNAILNTKLDYFKAKELYSKACNGGINVSCNNLGSLYANGQGVKQDYSKAKELYNKACDGGVVEGCSALAYMYKKGQGVERDEFKAKELFGKACDSGDANGCDEYAILNKKGF